MKSIKILFMISLAFLSQINIISNQNSIQSNYFYIRMSEFNNYQLLDMTFLITKFESAFVSILKCSMMCNKNSECVYFLVEQNNKCLICKRNLTLFLNFDSNGNSLIYQKQFEPTIGLINYWSFNKNVNDSIGDAHLYDGENAVLTYDRFGRPNCALSLTNGYYKIPPGVYFYGTQFSSMTWVKMKRFQSFSRMFDFGNGQENENVLLTLCRYSSSCYPYIIFFSGNDSIRGYSSKGFTLNKWQHIAFVYSFPFFAIYMDGIRVTDPNLNTNLSSFSLANVIRTSNFIGRSNWYVTGSSSGTDADIDDLKIFNRALSQQDIKYEMNYNL